MFPVTACVRVPPFPCHPHFCKALSQVIQSINILHVSLQGLTVAMAQAQAEGILAGEQPCGEDLGGQQSGQEAAMCPAAREANSVLGCMTRNISPPTSVPSLAHAPSPCTHRHTFAPTLGQIPLSCLQVQPAAKLREESASGCVVRSCQLGLNHDSPFWCPMRGTKVLR